MDSVVLFVVGWDAVFSLMELAIVAEMLKDIWGWRGRERGRREGGGGAGREETDRRKEAETETEREVRKRESRGCLLVGCLTSQQHASVSQGRICTDNFTCCHTEMEAADPTFHLTQSQYTDTGPTSPSADPITPGAWQGSHWSANFEVTGMTRPRKNPGASGIRTRDLPLSRRTP